MKRTALGASARGGNKTAQSIVDAYARVMLTHTTEGSHYGTLAGKPAKQPDLFTKPNDDGLFPGFSQTFDQLAPKGRTP